MACSAGLSSSFESRARARGLLSGRSSARKVFFARGIASDHTRQSGTLGHPPLSWRTAMEQGRDIRSFGTQAGALEAERVTAFLRRVYGWMFVGLLVTAGVALFVSGQPEIVQAIARTGFLFFGLIIAQLGLVWWISARQATLAPSTAAGLFLLYAGLNGVIFSMIL